MPSTQSPSPNRGSSGPVELSDGWAMRYAAPPSALAGANGIRATASGQIFVASFLGSKIDCVDSESGAVTAIARPDGDIGSPDDIAFDSRGNLYATELMFDRVSMRRPNGATQVIMGDLPAVNGITIHGDRIFIDECRHSGRLMELYPDGRAPRLITENLPLPNALCLGPDGYLYFPVLGVGEVWRVHPDGGTSERFVGDLAFPVAVKFDAKDRLVVLEGGSGALKRFDLPSAVPTRIGQGRVGPDNLDFSADGRIFVSNAIDGGLSEYDQQGRERIIIPEGLLGPWGISLDDGGVLHIADGLSLVRITPGGSIERTARYMEPGFPGFIVRNIAARRGGGFYATNSGGDIILYKPGEETVKFASGLGQIMGLCVESGESVAAAEFDGGRLLSVSATETRVLAHGLGRPTGVARAPDGGFYVADARAGRLLHVSGGAVSIVTEDLQEPHGVAWSEAGLFVVDPGDKTLNLLQDGRKIVVAAGLPIGASVLHPKRRLPGVTGLVPGPILPFTGLAAAGDGSLFISGDGNSSIVSIGRAARL